MQSVVPAQPLVPLELKITSGGKSYYYIFYLNLFVSVHFSMIWHHAAAGYVYVVKWRHSMLSMIRTFEVRSTEETLLSRYWSIRFMSEWNV